jgi:hypothetical protein
MPSSCTDAIYFHIIHSLLFSFPSPVSCYFNHVLSLIHYYICIVMSVFVYSFLLALASTYEGKHVTYVLLSLAYFAQHDHLQFHPISCKQQILF